MIDDPKYIATVASRSAKITRAVKAAPTTSTIQALIERIAKAEAKAIAAYDLSMKAGFGTLKRVPIVSIVSGPIALKRIVPDNLMPTGFDPGLFAICHATGGEYLTAADNEGSSNAGQADTDLIATVGAEHRITILKVQISPDQDEPGAQDGTATFSTFLSTLNAFGPRAEVDNTDATGNHMQEPQTANTELAFTFDHQPTGSSLIYVHLCHRPASIGGVVPAVAVIGNGVADANFAGGFEAVYTDRPLSVDWRSLGGCNANFSVTAVAPFSQEWEPYLAFARKQGFTRQ